MKKKETKGKNERKSLAQKGVFFLYQYFERNSLSIPIYIKRIRYFVQYFSFSILLLHINYFIIFI